MLVEQKVGTFYRAGIGLFTAIISLAFIYLIVFFLYTASRISFGGLAFLGIFAFLAYWFGSISYKLISSGSKGRAYLFSPRSIICIFTIIGLGALSGTIFRFINSDLENGFFALLVTLLLFPAGHYCWKHAKQQSAKQHGTYKPQ